MDSEVVFWLFLIGLVAMGIFNWSLVLLLI